jgi:hypothetical protein
MSRYGISFVRRLPQISPDDFRAMESKFGSAASTKTKVISKEKTTGDVILVKWRSIQRRISGVPTSEPARLSTGFARIDPRDGRLIASGEGEPSTPENAEKGILGRSATPRCDSGGLAATIEYSGDQVMLRRWNKAGEPLPEIKLFDGELAFRNFSRDCRHLLASKAENGWNWYIYSVATGKRVAEIHSSEPGAEFFVWENSLIYKAPAVIKPIPGELTQVEPERLVAIDFAGRELWARPIGETAYLRPPPGGRPETGPP